MPQDRLHLLLKSLENEGVNMRGSRGGRSLGFLAGYAEPFATALASDQSPPLSYAGLGGVVVGGSLASAGRVQRVASHDTGLRALAAADGLLRLKGVSGLLVVTFAGDEERQASASPGFLTNAPPRERPGVRYSKQRGYQQTTLLIAFDVTGMAQVLAGVPPDWSPEPSEPLPSTFAGSSLAVAVRSGPARTCAALVEPVLMALPLFGRNPFQGVLAMGGLLAAAEGRIPDGVPLISWDFDATQEVFRLEATGVFDICATFARGDVREIGAREMHAHLKETDDSWTLEAEPDPVDLPDSFEGSKARVSAEIRHGEVNGFPGAVISVLSDGPPAHYVIYGDARDSNLVDAIMAGLARGRGRLLASIEVIHQIREAAVDAGLLDAHGHGLEMPGLRAIGILGLNRRLAKIFSAS